MSFLPSTFRRRASGILADARTQAYLASATDRFREGREREWRELPAIDALRTAARSIRESAIANLDVHLTTLAERVRSSAGHVHLAADAAEACRIVVDIARRHRCRAAVKSKSMVSEEIRLNEALGAAGIDVVETDLGEWIIQLAGDRPYHIIAPALHKSKEEVAELFSAKTGQRVPADDISTLTAVARRELRQAFLGADIGISGVNFAVAESGTVVIVTNEGNGRFVTGLPRVHVAVMGMERLVSTWDELATMLELLARSATGQKMSSYVSAVTGPRRPGEADGPEAFHLVILDNGRSRIREGPFREALLCIRCGSCLNACPVYRRAGGHAYGAAYGGPIGAVLTPLLEGFESFFDLPHASSLCAACRDACPVKVDLPRLLLDERSEGVRQGRAGILERLGFKLSSIVLSQPWLYERSVGFARVVQRAFRRGRGLRHLPWPLSRWTDHREFPPVAERTFHERWAEEIEGEASPAGGIAWSRGEGGRVEPASRPPEDKEQHLVAPGLGSDAGELARRFISELEKVGGCGYVAKDLEEAAGLVLAIVGEARRVVCAEDELLADAGVEGVLRAANVEVAMTFSQRDPAKTRSEMASAGVGVTAADGAIASTGTMVLVSAPGDPRLVSGLPPVHIALVRAGRLFGTLAEWVATRAPDYRRRGWPSAITFITGPSRTGDIEQTLTIGAHGPKQVHVIVVMDGSA
ncbi:MAG: LutB/LldF family L-lactate oxidation iron-sulfur protein [Acidobacteriota bacterium]